MSMRNGEEPVAVLWDESFLWGVMTYRALAGASLPFNFIRARDISEGALRAYRAVFVPGGWASNKIRALGESGAAGIREFVKQGGTYIGLCGGAGLATSEGLGLVDVTRKPSSRRVPSFSGRIRLRLLDDPLWDGIVDPIFFAWWPSQFEAGDGVDVLARYEDACPDAFSSDLNIGDVRGAGGWHDLEEYYGINLDPARLLNEPSVIRGRYGRGTVLLSLVHFDSPADSNGETVLRNLWNSITKQPDSPITESAPSPAPGFRTPPLVGACTAGIAIVNELKEQIDELIDLGTRNFLWFKQGSFFLQWRRGVRGLEYCTLKVMIDEIAQFIAGSRGGRPFTGVTAATTRGPGEKPIEAQLTDIREVLVPFIQEASRLLLLERRAMLHEKLTFHLSANRDVRAMRERLFSMSKSHGGLFKEVIDRMDRLLYSLLTGEKTASSV